jgi:hypothetical protein
VRHGHVQEQGRRSVMAARDSRAKRFRGSVARLMTVTNRLWALRALVLLAAMLLSVAAWGASGDQYRCRYSGRVMDSCCCKARQKSVEPRNGTPEAKAASCCDALPRSVASAAPVLRDSAQPTSCLPAESTLALVAETSSSQVTSYAPPRCDRARDGPAIFLRDCRLLT